MVDERGASWKILLPVRPHQRVLALGLDMGQLTSLLRTWYMVDCLEDKDLKNLLPVSLTGQLKWVDPEYFSNTLYDIIVAGQKCETNSDQLGSLYAKCLAKNGTILCLGHFLGTLARALEKSATAIVRQYGVLPRDTPRIIFPLSSHDLRRKGLQFHQPGSQLARLGVKGLTFLSSIGVIKPFKNSAVTILSTSHREMDTLKMWLIEQIGFYIKDLIVYCGSDTVQRKITALAIIPNHQDRVVKIADSMPARGAIKRESNALRSLAERKDSTLLYPKLLLEKEWSGYLIQVQTSLPKRNNKQSQVLTEQHFNVLVGLSKTSRQTVELSTTVAFSIVQKGYSDPQENLPEPLARLASEIISSDMSKTPVICHRTHGDFAPWNMSVNNNSLSLWDWEDSIVDGLAYTDLFHFIIRQAILVGPWPGGVKLLERIGYACSRLQDMVALPKEMDYRVLLQIWLILEYIRKPHHRIIEIAAQMERAND